MSFCPSGVNFINILWVAICIEFGLVFIFWQKQIGEKAAQKTLVTLQTGLQKNQPICNLWFDLSFPSGSLSMILASRRTQMKLSILLTTVINALLIKSIDFPLQPIHMYFSNLAEYCNRKIKKFPKICTTELNKCYYDYCKLVIDINTCLSE